MRFLTAAASLLLSVWTVGAADDPKDAAKKLEGTYEVISFDSGQKPLKGSGPRDSFIVGGSQPVPVTETYKSLTIKDGEMVRKLVLKPLVGKETEREDKVKIALDPSKTPGHIDLRFGDNTLPGIYEIKGTDKGLELTIAYGVAPRPGTKPQRPTDFKGGIDSVRVFKLLRKETK